jgi:hypothetical protein
MIVDVLKCYPDGRQEMVQEDVTPIVAPAPEIPIEQKNRADIDYIAALLEVDL